MFQENHSGFLTRFASPYIMRLLKRGGLDYGVRLMKRNEGIPEELSGINMIKRGYNNEEEGGDYGIRMMKRNQELNNQRSSNIVLWSTGDLFSIEEMPKRGGEDPDEYEMMRRIREPYGVRMMKREEEGTRVIKKESEPYGFRLMKRPAVEENIDDDEMTKIKKESQMPYGIRMMKRDSSSGEGSRIIKKENEGYGLRLMKRESAGYGIRMMRRGVRGGYGIRMMKAKLDDERL